MSTFPSSKLIAFSFLAIVVCTTGAASAKECRWFGTAPLCDGECPAGWKLENLSGSGCIGTWGVSGTKAYCCKVEAACGPGKYGTPGCPYPPFGNAPDAGKKQPSGPTADAIMEGKKEKGSDVLVPEESTGPSPFGSKAPPNAEEAEALKRAKEEQAKRNDAVVPRSNLDVFKKADPTGGCGKGMHRGGGGGCYPDLH
jgi:hypothetical protein